MQKKKRRNKRTQVKTETKSLSNLNICTVMSEITQTQKKENREINNLVYKIK